MTRSRLSHPRERERAPVFRGFPFCPSGGAPALCAGERACLGDSRAAAGRGRR
jgi:hypothetical protein